MDVQIDTPTLIAAADAPQIEESAAPAGPVSVPGTMKIGGVDRDTMTTTVAGKVIVHTTRLSVLEQRLLSRAVDDRDEGKSAYIWDSIAATVRSIDGATIGFPSTDAQIEVILKRLGDEAAEYLFGAYTRAFAARVKAEAKN
jgi:hypothetical protein